MAETKKIPVKLGKVEVAKSSDPKLNKPATEALTAAVKAAVEKSKDLALGNVTGKEPGFQVDMTIHEITFDAAKAELFARLEMQLNTLPGPKMFANVSGKSKFAGINVKKVDKEMTDLIDEIMKKAGPDLRKGLEDKIAGLQQP